MILSRKSVELLAPAGNREVLEAAVASGADAVYLGGKRFNMRMHRTDANFDDDALKQAVKFTRDRGVKLYVTINNLLSDREIEPMREYLKFLDSIAPDALLVQDLAALELARELQVRVPLHASVMMNTHNEHAIEKLKEYGITRVVVGREMTLPELSLFKERTGIEVEYFMHGDMCVAESGQCVHSGVLFGQSGNRGRCLKPCRWSYRLVDEQTGEALDKNGPGSYKLALKDMCMYRNIPELIQAGVHSFKIEGRMRTAAFVERIVKTYRAAIDRYIADPAGYSIDETAWKELYENRSRDFSTCFALGKPDASAIGYSGTREPRFFSQAVKEAGLNPTFARAKRESEPPKSRPPRLSVRVADLPSMESALSCGADAVYIAGEIARPQKPWTLEMIRRATETAHNMQKKVIVMTPRTTMARECGELQQLFAALSEIKPDAVMVGNLGALRMAKNLTDLPVQTDLSFNVFNHLSAKFLKTNGACVAAVSLELAETQVQELLELSPLPLEVIVHGATESMISDNNIPALALGYDPLANPEFLDRRYALLDSANETHPIRIDQYGRNHILFAKDLCLLRFLDGLTGAASLRVEAQHYDPALTALLTKTYRTAIDRIISGGADPVSEDAALRQIAEMSPRALGIGAFRHRASR